MQMYYTLHLSDYAGYSQCMKSSGVSRSSMAKDHVRDCSKGDDPGVLLGILLDCRGEEHSHGLR